MFRIALGICLFFILQCFAYVANAGTVTVTTRASCAIVGITPEQASHMALQRARAAAIEQAVGVGVVSSSLVTDGKVAADFIKIFARGYITKEKAHWLPLSQYQGSSASPPIPEYGVELVATVFIPDKTSSSLGLKAWLNRTLFRAGELCILTVSTRKPARIGVFNLTADDRVVMLFPSDRAEVITPGDNAAIVLPTPESGLELSMTPLPGHKRNAEGFFVAALPRSGGKGWMDEFEPRRSMRLSEFFAKYSTMAERTEDLVLAYETVAKEK